MTSCHWLAFMRMIKLSRVIPAAREEGTIGGGGDTVIPAVAMHGAIVAMQPYASALAIWHHRRHLSQCIVHVKYTRRDVAKKRVLHLVPAGTP